MRTIRNMRTGAKNMIYLLNDAKVVLGLSEAKGNKVPAHYSVDGTKTEAKVGEEVVNFLQNVARTIYTVVFITDTWYYTTNEKFNAIDEFTFVKLEDKPKAEAKPKAVKATTPTIATVPAIPLVLSPEEMKKREVKVIKKGATDINELREEMGVAKIVSDIVAITESEIESAADLVDAAVDAKEAAALVPANPNVEVIPQLVSAKCKGGKHKKCNGVTSGMKTCDCICHKPEGVELLTSEASA
jgi:hypothetical protein